MTIKNNGFYNERTTQPKTEEPSERCSASNYAQEKEIEIFGKTKSKKTEQEEYKYKAVNFEDFFRSNITEFGEDCFEEGEHILYGDTDNDGKLSYDEVKAQVNKTPKRMLIRLADRLGIKIDARGNVQSLRENINNAISILQETDKNNDMQISESELNNYIDKNKSDDAILIEGSHQVKKITRLYEILGIPDGKYYNNQGNLGDCWLLGVGQFISEHEDLYSQAFQHDNKGVTITFKGITDEEGKPFQCRVSVEQIRKEHDINLAMNDYSSSIDGGSNDPDAIALEIAMKEAITQWNKNMEKIKDYLKHSSHPDYQKPDIENLSNRISYDQYKRYKHYIWLSESYNNEIKYINKPRPTLPFIMDKKANDIIELTDEQVSQIKDYVSKQPEFDASKYFTISKMNKYSNSYLLNNFIKDYINDSTPVPDENGNIIPKPSTKGFLGFLDTDLDGGRPEIAIQFLLNITSTNIKNIGDNSYSEYFDEKTFNEKYKDKSKISVHLRESFDEYPLYKDHEYYIKSINGDKVVLQDSHDSKKETTTSIADLKKCRVDLSITDFYNK